MLGLLFRLMFSLSIIVWYSVNVWKMISEYFNKEFHNFLYNSTDEIEDNEF